MANALKRKGVEQFTLDKLKDLTDNAKQKRQEMAKCYSRAK